MKWPETLILVRHDESAFNALKKAKEQNPIYQQFKQQFELDPTADQTIALAKAVKDRWALNIGDHNTPLAQNAGHQAETMAGRLKEIMSLPDVILVSPYERTLHTLANMKKGWPELDKVQTYEEERIREQEHGLSLLYNDWRILHTLHPEQRNLYQIEGEYWYRYPQGESVADVRERNRSWLGTLIREFANQRVLAVTHHLTILATRANLERLSAQQFLELNDQNKPINCSVTIYRGYSDLGRDGKLILATYNAKLY